MPVNKKIKKSENYYLETIKNIKKLIGKQD
jgi:hypothetical protein